MFGVHEESPRNNLMNDEGLTEVCHFAITMPTSLMESSSRHCESSVAQFLRGLGLGGFFLHILMTLKHRVRPVYEVVMYFWAWLTERRSGAHPIIIQGIQRSGTNYFAVLLQQAGYRILNNIDPRRNDPRHKHFRWQDDKTSIVMDSRYRNARFASSIEEINTICGYPSDYKHVVIFRDPIAWINSIFRWGLNNNWYSTSDEFFSKKLHIAYLQEWDEYYKFWEGIAAKSPTQVKLINYEQLLREPHESIREIDLFVGFGRSEIVSINPVIAKVRHSQPIKKERERLDQAELNDIEGYPFKFDWKAALEKSFL